MKFHKDWFRHSKVDRGDTQTQRKQGALISLLPFFQNKESTLKKIKRGRLLVIALHDEWESAKLW
jgi:hypothetical protein